MPTVRYIKSQSASEKIGTSLGHLLFFCSIPVIFRTFCLVVKRNFVYLQSLKGCRYLQSPQVQRIIRKNVVYFGTSTWNQKSYVCPQ